MNELLHYVLATNCGNNDERFRLEQKVRRSDEWLNFSTQIANALGQDHDSGPAQDRLVPLGGHRQDAPTSKSKFGENLRRLRKELGWSANKLADESGIDKKQVIAHEHGTEPHPKNKAVYADTLTKGFTKKSGVSTIITVQELEN